MKKLIRWLIMRKVKNAAGEMEANGVSVSKVCAVILALIEAAEFVGPYFGYNIQVPKEVKGMIATVGGIALKEGIDRSAPPAPVK